MEKRATVKRWVGHPLFIYAALRTWFSKYDRRHPHFAVRYPGAGGHPRCRDGYFTVVLNTSPYTYLGNRPLELSPDAGLDRGLVAVTFRSLRAAAVPGRHRPDAAGTAHRTSDRASTSTTTWPRLEIESARPFPYQVDGDYLGETRRLRFQHRPDVLDLVLPLEPQASR